jgi:hypothetical protein
MIKHEATSTDIQKTSIILHTTSTCHCHAACWHKTYHGSYAPVWTSAALFYISQYG